MVHLSLGENFALFKLKEEGGKGDLSERRATLRQNIKPAIRVSESAVIDVDVFKIVSLNVKSPSEISLQTRPGVRLQRRPPLDPSGRPKCAF